MLRCNTVVSRLWQKICRKTSAGSCKSLTIPVRIKASWLKLVFTAMIAITIAGCGAGGGGGSGSSSGSGGGTGNSAGSSSGSTDFVVSGSVSAPGGTVAFLPRKNLFAKLADVLISPAYTAISGLASVPDGTQVDLARIDKTGMVISLFATTTTSAGSYSFNLTKLGLTTANDLVVQVTSLSSGAKMRAFVAADTVNIDPVSETAVRLVLERAVVSSLSNFTTQELIDIGAAVNLLVTTKLLTSGLDIDATVTAFKNAVAADASITSFIIAASATGQTLQGPGDIGNYFPFDQGNTWVYQGTEESGGTTTPYTNTLQITGTKLINGITTTIFHETNSGNTGASEDYLAKDSQAISNYGNNDATDFLTPQFAPYREYVFPLGLNSSFEAINKSGLTWPDSLGDGDGKPETASVNVTVTVAGFEIVTVPAGTYTNAAKIVANVTISVVLSADGTTATETITSTEWYAPGVGLVKSVNVLQTTVQNVIDTSITTEELVKFVPPPSFALISAGSTFTCGITINGVAYCWGNNLNGELGNGTRNNSAIPIPVSGGYIFSSLSAAENSVCGIAAGGTIYCWGNGTGGQFGNGAAVVSLIPVAVSGGLTFKSVSSGNWHTCGITTNGVAYCWGVNYDGRLGDGTTKDSAVPVLVTGGLSFTSVSAGSFHVCGITISGAAYCWGDNSFDQLGNGRSVASTATPIAVSGGLVFASISSGRYLTCGVTMTGTAYCWGMPGFMSSIFTPINSKVPATVAGGLMFQSLSSGGGHVCGISTGGQAYCWGLNTSGQLGDGTMTTGVTAPTAVAGEFTFASISGGGGHSCGVTIGNRGYCWGNNFYGQLGNSTLVQRTTPTAVLPSLQ